MKSKFVKFSLYVQGLFYMGAGINHFWHPKPYMSITPPWLTQPLAIVYISGIAEFILGALLLVPKTRVVAAWGIIFLLIVVFPANIQMLINYVRTNNSALWIAIVRLPIQLLLIWWAWVFTKEPKLK